MASRSVPSTSKGGARRRILNPTEITQRLNLSDSESESDVDSDAEDLADMYAPEEAANYSDSADSDEEPLPKEPQRLKSKKKPGSYIYDRGNTILIQIPVNKYN